MKVLVIGSHGYMGGHLMRGLTKEGMEPEGVSTSDGSGIEPVSGLLPESFQINGDVSTVIYVAQSPHYRQMPDKASHVFAVNSLSVVRAAVAAHKAGVQRFIYVSTGTVYAPSFLPLAETAPLRRDNLYAMSKLHGEEALGLFRHYMDVVVVRPFGIYGPGQEGRMVPNLISKVRSGAPIVLHPKSDDLNDDGGLRISLCHINDAVNVLIRIARTGGPAYLNLAGVKAMSIREMALIIGQMLGRSPNFSIAPDPRDSDLIADINALRKLRITSFVDFKIGIKEMTGG